jgi:hypothetical protein
MSAPPPHPDDRVRCLTCGKRFAGEKARERFRQWPRACKETKGCSLTLTYASSGGQTREAL